AFTGMYTGTVKNGIATAYHITAHLTHGALRNGGNADSCYSTFDNKTNLTSGSSAAISYTGACDNVDMLGGDGPPHGFGDPVGGDRGDFAYINTSVGITSGLGPSGSGGAGIGGFNVNVQSVYKVAPPKIMLDRTKLTLQATPGAKTSNTVPLTITN